ncbi:complex III assembly factor LYRM7 [Epargyreus clarus]|uniref:complex III assembly factor LYRM7 n=1 Tax=Epargyreus clarus TaxID=520877 RepID=UPI003C2C39FE
MTDLRRMVLSSFKKLHRTRMKVFSGDERALTAARVKINEEYSKNKHVDNEEAIKAMIKFGEDVERELRTQIIQAREIRPGVYEAKITDETVKLNNIPFNDKAVPDEGIKGGRLCCKDQAQNK